MVNVLADLALESEAATVATMRLARAFDADEPEEAAFRRLALAVLKYWVCKRGAAARRRGARVPGRQRLCRGGADGAALPRHPARHRLGGLGQRDRARRPARAQPGAGVSAEAFLAECELAAGADAALRRAPRVAARAPRRAADRPARGRMGARAGSSRTWRSRCRPALLLRHSPAACPRRSAPGASNVAAWPSATCRGASTARRSSSGRSRSRSGPFISPLRRWQESHLTLLREQEVLAPAPNAPRLPEARRGFASDQTIRHRQRPCSTCSSSCTYWPRCRGPRYRSRTRVCAAAPMRSAP